MSNVNIVEELKQYLKNTSKEQQKKDWEEIKEYGKFGPTVEEFLYKNPIAPPYNPTKEELYKSFETDMDREEEIRQAANKKYYPYDERGNHLSNNSLLGFGFLVGAEWADDNPSIKVIKKAVDMYLFNYTMQSEQEQDRQYYWDYIKEHWND